ncbi:MAG: hypothetical protein ACPGVK_02400 [Halocynthiibacter sp.]
MATDLEIQTVQQLDCKISTFSDIINQNFHRHENRTINQNWLIICSAYGVLCDCNRVLRAHLSKSDLSTDEKYLHLYGVLNALYLQQDAIIEISKILPEATIDYKNHPEIFDIRNLRNRVAGHPANTKTQDGKSQFIRPQMGDGELIYMSSKDGHENTTNKINLNACIKTQSQTFIDVLDKMNKKLNDKWAVHKEKFQGTSLAGILNGWKYASEKILTYPIDLLGLPTLEKKLTDLSCALEKRGAHLNTAETSEPIEAAQLAVKKLTKSLEDEAGIEKLVYAAAIERLFEDLEKLATDIDERYAPTA